jgi:hypothetical protein
LSAVEGMNESLYLSKEGHVIHDSGGF